MFGNRIRLSTWELASKLLSLHLAAGRLPGVCDPACKMNNSQPSKKKRCQGIPGKRHTLNLSKGMKARNSMAVEESIRDRGEVSVQGGTDNEA